MHYQSSPHTINYLKLFSESSRLNHSNTSLRMKWIVYIQNVICFYTVSWCEYTNIKYYIYKKKIPLDCWTTTKYSLCFSWQFVDNESSYIHSWLIMIVVPIFRGPVIRGQHHGAKWFPVKSGIYSLYKNDMAWNDARLNLQNRILTMWHWILLRLSSTIQLCKRSK